MMEKPLFQFFEAMAGNHLIYINIGINIVIALKKEGDFWVRLNTTI